MRDRILCRSRDARLPGRTRAPWAKASCSPWRLLQATGGSRTVHSGDDAIDDRAREKIGNGSQHGSSGVGADVPAVTLFLEQIRVHVGVFVDAEGEMVANRQREIRSEEHT